MTVIPFRLLAFTFVTVGLTAASAQTLLLSYNFDEKTPVYASTGKIREKLEGKGDAQTAGEPGSGVSGLPGDRAWDASANTIQAFDPDSKAVNNSRLVQRKDVNAIDNLSAFTLVFWFNADQALSNAANRFFYDADTSTKTAHGFSLRGYSRASGGRRSYALELIPGADGQAGQPVASQYFEPGKGYARVGEWVFAAVVWNGGRVDFYVGDRDGAVTPAGSGILPGPLGDEKQALVVGNVQAANRGFDGRIDNFRFYDGALSLPALETLRAADVAGRKSP